MPVYTYHCDNCNHEFDKQQSFSDNPLKSCPECKKKALYKVYKPAQVVFKGSGYYVTDNKSSNNKKTKTTTDAKESKNGKSETKSEKKSETKNEKKETTAKEKA